jgi:hypothetical protein
MQVVIATLMWEKWVKVMVWGCRKRNLTKKMQGTMLTVDNKEQEEGESEQYYNDEEQGDNVEEQEVENG